MQSQTWDFLLSSFMVLLGEQEEVNYRLMGRNWFECCVAAPVAGLQSYCRSAHVLTEVTGPFYFSPFGGKTAPLRNQLFFRTLSLNKLLRDSNWVTYRVKPAGKATKKHYEIRQIMWICFTWISLGGIGAWLRCMPSTWVGASNCAVLVVGSIALRVIDLCTLGTSEYGTSQGDKRDAIFVLGRRNACFILEGCRADVSAWTGYGLCPKPGRLMETLQICGRVLSGANLLFIFITVPNGNFYDHLAFIILNILGQLNTFVCQRMAAGRCLKQFELIENQTSATRTHVYASLLKNFGNGQRVDSAGLIPKTPAWDLWRQRLLQDKGDPKQLWDRCAAEVEKARDGVLATTEIRADA